MPIRKYLYVVYFQYRGKERRRNIRAVSRSAAAAQVRRLGGTKIVVR